MEKSWKHFLERHGALISHKRVMSFGDPQAELAAAVTVDVIADLSHKGLIKVSGPDAQKFLQGQLTCDLNEITTAQSHLGAHCNAKGRILATFRIFQREENYYLFMPSSIIAATLAQLQKYAVFSKVTLEDVSSQLLAIGLAGPNAVKILSEFFTKIPAAVDTATAEGRYTLIQIHGTVPRFEIFAEPEHLMIIWDRFINQAKPVSVDAWQLLTVMSAIPNVYPATMGRFTPHLINYQAIHGVSFNKGCYTGQEIVARMEHLGKLKSHMYRGYLSGQTIPRPGEKLFPVNAQPEADDIGEVVIAKPDPKGGFQLLIVVKDDYVKNDSIYVENHPQARITFLELPYPITLKK